MATRTDVALLRDLGTSITIHPFRIDTISERLQLLRLTVDDLNDSSFLDQRVLRDSHERAWVAWDAIEAAMAGQPAGTLAHYIFHVGHCGSTLLSRLLGELGVVALREPLPLRTLAEVMPGLDAPESLWDRKTFESRLLLLARLFDRGQGPRSVKATSFCNDLAILLLGTANERRATIVYTALRPYLANVLAGPASRLELRAMAPLRYVRLRDRVGDTFGRLHEMTPGELAAMTWATEASALAHTWDSVGPSRLARVDFDRFLADAEAGLRLVADHVHPGVPDGQLAATIRGPAMKRYSKAPEHAYDAELRRQVLAEGEQRFHTEIQAGISWCERAAGRFPAVSRALDLFEAA